MTLLYAFLTALLAVPAVIVGSRGCVWALGKLKALQRRDRVGANSKCVCDDSDDVLVITHTRSGPRRKCVECGHMKADGGSSDPPKLGRVVDPCDNCGSRKVAPTVDELDHVKSTELRRRWFDGEISRPRGDLRCIRCHAVRRETFSANPPSIKTVVYDPKKS